MDASLTTFFWSAGLVIAMELVLWKLFRRKIAGLLFPLEADQSFFRFFTLNRLRAIAVVHTIVLLVMLFLSLSFLW
ncbi:MAG: hypothetical protein Q7R81_06860 [Candidatus Peregrinibacteria bacterium]|nr:hypothetical protein [Candidatus Peregrinibacteria bacterium]